MASPAAGKNDPFVILTYGPPKSGKSVDMGYSFPTALFLAAPGALQSIRNVCGYQPAQESVRTLEEATELIKSVDVARYETVVIDDFSFLAEQTLATLEKKHSGFKFWGALREAVLDFRDSSRFAGCNVVFNAWESAPRTSKGGSRVRGGPMLSGNLPEQIPAMCDVVLRAVHEPARQPWPTAYHCSADPSYVMGDRFDVASVCSPAPMNLAELMRVRRPVSRHPKLAGQEEQVETIAGLLTGEPSEDREKINEIYAKLLAAKPNPAVARWTMRDAVDRVTIRTSLKRGQQTFFSSATNDLLG